MVDYTIGILLALLVLAVYSIGDTFAKKIVVKFGYAKTAAIVTGVSLVPFIILFILVPNQQITTYSIELSAISGIFYGLGFVFLYKSLATEQTTNTMALSEFFKGVLVLGGVFFFANVLNGTQVLGVVLIFLGSVLIIMTEKLRINQKMFFALVGFLLWAGLWLMLGYAIGISKSYVPEGFISTLVAFISALVFMFVFKEHRRHASHSKNANVTVYIVAVGLAVGIGSLVFTFLVFSKLLSVGSAIIALTPIIVAIASRKIYLDKLTTVQFAGLLVMVLGALILGLAQYLPAI